LKKGAKKLSRRIRVEADFKNLKIERGGKRARPLFGKKRSLKRTIEGES